MPISTSSPHLTGVSPSSPLLLTSRNPGVSHPGTDVAVSGDAPLLVPSLPKPSPQGAALPDASLVGWPLAGAADDSSDDCGRDANGVGDCDALYGAVGVTAAPPSSGLPLPTTPPPPLRRIDWHPLGIALAACAAHGSCLTSILPVRPKALLAAVGNNDAAAAITTGALAVLSAVVGVVASPLLGAASDTFGRRPILLATGAGAAVELAVLGSAPSSVLAHVAATVIAAAAGGWAATLSAVVADVAAGTGSETRAYGAAGVAWAVALVVGPAMGGVLEAWAGVAAPFWGAAGGVTAVALAVAVWLPETGGARSRAAAIPPPRTPTCGIPSGRETPTRLSGATPPPMAPLSSPPALGGGGSIAVVLSQAASHLNPLPPLRLLFANDLLRPLAATAALSELATRGPAAIFYYYVHSKFGWDTPDVAVFLSTLGAALLFSQGVLAPAAVAAAKGYGGEAPVIVGGFLLDATYLVLLGVATHGWHLYGALAVATAAWAAAPALRALTARQVPPSAQGRLQGGLAAVSTLVAPAAPVVTTALYGYGAPRGVPGAPLYALACVSLVGAVVAAKAVAHPRLVHA
ncbi:hypothetical protein MMPV_003735 [Pyropia vietnamensis]